MDQICLDLFQLGRQYSRPELSGHIELSAKDYIYMNDC
jgi:hypothetical protein